MSLWANTGAESGILRKNDKKDNLEDLLVFGYACKLFRDDEKALEIDQGKHLIPWMGDNTLKIDRYDGRGALSDLFPYESSKEGYDAMRWLGLSESDRKIEQLCDEERYYSLHRNEEEDELYKEEELKRSQKQTHQFQYNYDEPPKEEGPTLPPEEDDEPFVPPPDLDLPVGINLPKTVKQNARIEKTALFISKEGPQMEILLKTKQSGNPQFGFLTQDNDLFRYYRHILMAIKTGRYKFRSENETGETGNAKEDSYYLHPSLASETTLPVPIPQISYKPSADCAYSQLIQRIQGTQPTVEGSGPSAAPENTYHLQYYQQYGYYPTYDQYQEYQPSSTNPYAQIVSNLKPPNGEIVKTAVIYDKSDSCQKSEVKSDKTVSHPPKTTQKPLFALAEYSDSENESENGDESENNSAIAVVVPPSDVQVIVDKMAAYVAKNGADFEAIVKSKGDPRFVFLESGHIFHLYYKYKLKECTDKMAAKTEVKPVVQEPEKVVQPPKPETTEEHKKLPPKPKEKKIISPVSFSIKKPQTTSDQVARDKSALPIEDSTDDEDPKQETTPNSQSNPPEPETEEKQTKEDSVIEIEDPIMELIDLTEDLEEKRDKRAEDRLKDKIAMAAREKLAEKNRALQLERKRRAAMFLSQLKPYSHSSKDVEEVRTIRQSSPEPGEIITSEISDEISRYVYRIDKDSPRSPKNEGSNGHRGRSSRSRSSQPQKTSHHRRKSHKRSRSRKRKRDRRSHDRKKTKRHYSRSHTRSKSPYHRPRSEKRDEVSDQDSKKSKKRREKSPETSCSSDYNSESNK